MSDFIFSINPVKDRAMFTKSIQSIYEEDDKPKVNEYHGDWGSLAVSHNLYNGFDVYEEESYLVAVIGGPVLTYRDNSFLIDSISSEGTESIFHRWKSGKMNWDKDLSGPFAVLIINKTLREVIFVTDIMSFIPVYKYKTADEFIICTHVDVLAEVSKEIENIDLVSQVDFILHGIVTYPYTMYQNIKQVAPATVHKYKITSTQYDKQHYWFPYEEECSETLNNMSIKLRESLQNYINKIVAQTTNIAQFISGGEDSRTLSALLQPLERDAFIFINEMNLEGKIANKVANIYGARLYVHTRHELHYSHILPSCSNLVGSGSQYHHAHTYGFHRTCNLQSYDAVFGGLFSDALLKGARIKKANRSGKIPFKPEIKRNDISRYDSIEIETFSDDILNQLTNRRRKHLKLVEKYRPNTAEEWFELWPSSMNMNIPNIHANRRLFRSYEPFMANDVVKIAALAPQKWKLNRILFHKMAKPLLKPSKWLRHGDGWFPYYSWRLKSITVPFVILKRKLERKLSNKNKVHGPWGDWNTVLSSANWSEMAEKYGDSFHKMASVMEEQNVKDIINNEKLTILQRINFMQNLYHNYSKENK